MSRDGLWLRPTGESITLPDGREAKDASAFISGQGPGYVVLKSGSVSECTVRSTGCLVETPEGELWAVRAMPPGIARKYLDAGDAKA